MFQELYILFCYNEHFRRRLAIDCPCYREYYATQDKLLDTVIEKRRSYMACLCVRGVSNKRSRQGMQHTGDGRVLHCCVPIMIGSFIDYCIRGHDAVVENRALWGALIVKGLPRIYSSFSTYDALTMHVRKTSTNKTIEWYTYVNGNGLAISYDNSRCIANNYPYCVTWTYLGEMRSSDSHGDGWLSLLSDCRPFGNCNEAIMSTTGIVERDYVHMFNAVLSSPYDMNDLSNRQIVNPVFIMLRFIDRILNKRGTSAATLAQAFESGAFYEALSKRSSYENGGTVGSANASVSDPSSCGKLSVSYPQNYDNTLHEGRSNKACYFLGNVTRASNDAVRNSPALTFPKDAHYYYCMLNTKDLKSVGEQNVLADYTCMTEGTDRRQLFLFLQKHFVGKASARLCIDGFLTNRYCEWTLDALCKIKSRFPNVTSKYYGTTDGGHITAYVILSTRDSIPIKFHDGLNAFFSPAETQHFSLEFPEADILSVLAKQLDLVCLRKTPPSKATVSINNIKGSVAMATSLLHTQLMHNSLGVTCYLMTDKRLDLVPYAMLSGVGTQCTSQAVEVYARLSEHFRLDEEKELNKTARSTNPARAVTALCQNYPIENMKYACRTIDSAGSTFIGAVDESLACKIEDYRNNIMLQRENYKVPSPWNLRVMAAFGNPYGACVEDGVVMDTEALSHTPSVRYNACITIDFMFERAKMAQLAHVMLVDDSRCANNETSTFLGYVVSPCPVKRKNSKHTRIVEVKIGTHYYHMIEFLPKATRMYGGVSARHVMSNNKTLTIVINGYSEERVGVGSKVANGFGQKNVISKVISLRDCTGVTRDGRLMHAQIVYSDVSLVGRMPSGQLYSMLTSPDLAIGPRGEIIAPIDLVLHSLHPHTNIKAYTVKVDTYSNTYAFDSHNLTLLSQSLRQEPVNQKVLQLIGFLGYTLEYVSETLPAQISSNDGRG